MILKGLEGIQDVQECHLTRWVKGRRKPMHLRVLGTPLAHNNERYALLAMAEVSPKRKR